MSFRAEIEAKGALKVTYTEVKMFFTKAPMETLEGAGHKLLDFEFWLIGPVLWLTWKDESTPPARWDEKDGWEHAAEY